MLILHLYNDIPQLNVGLVLLPRSDQQGDPERMRLSSTTGHQTPKYTQVIIIINLAEITRLKIIKFLSNTTIIQKQ